MKNLIKKITGKFPSKLITWIKFKKIAKTTLYVFLTICCLVILMSFLNTKKLPRVFVVQSGSMEPVIKVGSIIITLPKSRYRVDEIVTFNSLDKKNTSITHRIIETNAGNFSTKGDANETTDVNLLTPDQIIGKVLFTIPIIGYFIEFTRSFLGLVIVIIIPATIIIYEESKTFIKEFHAVFLNSKHHEI